VIFYLEDLEKLYQQAPRNHTQFQQVEWCKIILQISALYTSNEQIEKEYRKNNTTYNSLKKYLGINFKKDVKDLYKENYKLL
jgi:hypothetical protein